MSADISERSKAFRKRHQWRGIFSKLLTLELTAEAAGKQDGRRGIEDVEAARAALPDFPHGHYERGLKAGLKELDEGRRRLVRPEGQVE